MLKGIKEIGEYLLSENKDYKYYEDIGKDNCENVFIILMRGIENKLEFEKIEMQEYTEKKDSKYLYKKGRGARGPDITPASKITIPEKTFKIKIKKCIENLLNEKADYRFTDKEVELLNNIFECLEINTDKIINELKEKIGKEKNNLLTLGFLVNTQEIKFIGDLNLFRKVLEMDSIKLHYHGYGVDSIGENKRCSLCMQERKEVFGFTNIYKFYTVDNPGFVAGGFNQELAWKNYPVCVECIQKLETGKEYIEKKLDFPFYGFRYLLIPKFLIKEKIGEVLDIMIEYRKEVKKVSFEEKSRRLLTNAEDEILDWLSGQENYMNVNFLFYDNPGGSAAFNILLFVENILPSRFNKLFQVKDSIDKRYIFKENGIEFNFRILRNFFPYEKGKKQMYNKYFLELVYKTFSGIPIDYYFILDFIMRLVRNDFITEERYNKGYFKFNTLKGFLLLYYLKNLDILKNFNNGGSMETTKQFDEFNLKEFPSIKEKIFYFFESNKDFFNSHIKRAIFLEGVLVQNLLDIQYSQRKSTPFRERLKGLKLSKGDIINILPEIIQKLEEYKSYSYKELESIISEYFILDKSKWKITNDEISFYFTLGMNLNKIFKTKREE